MARKSRGLKAAHTRASAGHGSTKGLKAAHKAAAPKASKSTAGRKHTTHESRHL